MNSTHDVFRDRLVVVAGTCRNALVRQMRALGARDVLFLGRRDPGLADCHFNVLGRSSRVAANNCTVAILFGGSAFALRSRRLFQSFEHVCLPLGAGWLCGMPGLLRYASTGRLAFTGWANLAGIPFPVAVFRNEMRAGRRRTRIFGPDRWGSRKILESIGDLDYVLLRWAEQIEEGSHQGDLDILATARAADVIEARLAVEAGTAPIDLYSEDGSGGRTFKSVAYFPPAMARKVIASAVTRPSGVKVASPEWRFVSFCFHLLFHKSSSLAPGTEDLGPDSFGKAHYMKELHRLAHEAGLSAPRSVSELEAVLRDRDVLPEIDTIGFLSEGNSFLKQRYRTIEEKPPGLAVFLVRDFKLGSDLVSAVRQEIESSGFRILDEVPVEPDRDRIVVERIRGGNWSDAAAADGTALPIHAFICHDPHPLRPSPSVLKRYPRLDNERVLLKARVREAVAQEQGVRKLNVVHASDNSTEAEFYIRALGIERPAE